MATLQDQIASHLLTTKSLPVSRSWLQTFTTTTTTSNVPLSTLAQAALYRILNSDIRETLSTNRTSSLLPVDISDPTVKERRLSYLIPVQVLDIEDIGTSVWSQVEAIERVERGEAVRGREIIRTVNVDDREVLGNSNGNANNNNAATASGMGGSSSGPHRLILQDAANTMVVGIELKSVDGIGIGKLPIGAKMILRSVTVARGMALLVPDSVTILGGKIESLDQEWKGTRKARLLERLQTEENTNGETTG